MKTTTKLWIWIVVLALLSPLGLIIPEYFNAGGAWGEWGADELKKMIGYIPRGLQKLSAFWNAPLPDYAFKGWEDAGIHKLTAGYIISAFFGAALVVLTVYLISKFLVKKNDKN